MSRESTSGYAQAVFTPDKGGLPTVTFCYLSMDMPDFVLGDKINVTTNCDVAATSGTVGPKSFLPASLYEIVDAKFTCPMDWAEIDGLRGLIAEPGTLVFTSSFTTASYTFDNCWVKAVETDDWGVEDQGQYTVTFEFGGDEPTLA
jgi:hypothetical protein